MLKSRQLFKGAKVTETSKESIFSLNEKNCCPMPGDSTVVHRSGDSVRLADSVFQQQVQSLSPVGGDEGVLAPAEFILLIIALFFLINWLYKKYRQRLLHRAAIAASSANFTQYDELLANHNGYYKSLPDTLRYRFVERVIWFMETKTFICINLPQDEKMSLLISAASVQISFGLDKFLLDFFDTIYIMPHDYKFGTYTTPFEGHVNSNGIYLSWDNFIKGYEDYTDGDNVGIHEMAHALAYVNFMAGANDGQDDAFIKRFYDFSAVARPLFNEMQNGQLNLLGSYAATNYNEFWAVAVETFFEKSANMKIALPALYASLCSLLNQDPLLPEKLLSVPEACGNAWA